jgi:hypothetical protein
VHERQLSTLAGVSGLLVDAGLDWWLFGGWAVGFYVGAVTRPHHALLGRGIAPGES